MSQLDGTVNDDILEGGDGDDVINGRDGDDILIGHLGTNVFDGGAGVDTVDYSWTSASVHVDLLNADFQSVIGNSSGAKDRFVNVENIVGSINNDVLVGDNGSNRIHGGAGDDTLRGGAHGDDVLRGGDGADFIGGYEDTYGINIVKYYGDAGNDFFSLSDYNEDSQYQVYGGTGDDHITAQMATKATLRGEEGNDFIEIRDGRNYRLVFGDGHDRLELWASTEVGERFVVEDFHATGASSDILDLGAYLAFQLLANPYLGHAPTDWDARSNPFAMDYMRLVQSGADTLLQIRQGGGLGAPYSTIIRFENTDRASFTAAAFDGYDPNGGAVVNLNLSGSAGSDVVYGGVGADVIHGNAGNDSIYSGLGDDQAFGDDGDDYLNDDISGDDRLYGGVGDDHISIYRAMGQTFSEMTLDGGVGDDRISLSSYVRTASATVMLSGGDGNDYLSLFGSTRATVDAGAGNDEIYFHGFQTAGTSTLLGGEGNDRISSTSLEVVVMNGGSGDDRLESGAGGDWLDGGLGIDTLIGGAGDDVFVLGDGLDTLVELAGGGRDTVYVQKSYQIQSNFEVVRVLPGFAADLFGRDDQGDQLVGNERANYLGGRDGADNLFGFEGDDALDGGAGVDWLDGGSGKDVVDGGAGNDGVVGGAGDDWVDGGAGDDNMFGGLGDDVYLVESLGDRVIEEAGGGVDTVLSSVDLQLFGNVEILRLTGAASIKGFGSDGAERLYGNAAANYLGGAGGADSIFGGVGNDAIDGGADDDWLDGEGGADSLAGGVGNDGLSGGAGNDWIDGGAGLDVLFGGAGADVLIGGAGHDQFVFQPGSGADRILDFTAGGGEDAINLQAYQAIGVTWSYAQIGADVVIGFSNGDNIQLVHAAAADLQSQGYWIF